MKNFLKRFDAKRLNGKICINQVKAEGEMTCSRCQKIVCPKVLQAHTYCCQNCGYHFPLPAQKRIDLLVDQNSFVELFTQLKPIDHLDFVDTEPYKDRLVLAQKKTGRDDAIYVGVGLIDERPVALGVMDFSFFGGSMGSVVGEKLTRLIEYAIEKRVPLVIVCASGGARMQESTLSLMQMAKTSAALSKLAQAGLPYVSILTHPTMGGVTASFATLADIIIAEPGALIGFAGPRVVEQTTGQKLKEGAQKSEFLLEKGMIDQICEREDLKSRISFFLDIFMKDCKLSSDDHESMSDKLRHLLKSTEKHLSPNEALFLA